MSANACTSPEEADVTLSTAHRAKGLEWDKVRLLDDFEILRPQAKDEEQNFSQEEVNLLYVAVSRGRESVMMANGDPVNVPKPFKERDALEITNQPYHDVVGRKGPKMKSNFQEDPNEKAREFVRDNIEELCIDHFFPEEKREQLVHRETFPEILEMRPKMATEVWRSRWLRTIEPDSGLTEQQEYGGDFFELLQRYYREVHEKELWFGETVEADPRDSFATESQEGTTDRKRTATRHRSTLNPYIQAMDEASKRELTKDRGFSLACVENLVKARRMAAPGEGVGHFQFG